MQRERRRYEEFRKAALPFTTRMQQTVGRMLDRAHDRGELSDHVKNEIAFPIIFGPLMACAARLEQKPHSTAAGSVAEFSAKMVEILMSAFSPDPVNG